MSGVHLEMVRKCRCLGCGTLESVCAHHLISGLHSERGMGLKAPDSFTIPLCDTCHRKLHGLGSDTLFFDPKSINAKAVAIALWHLHELGAGERAYERVINDFRVNALMGGRGELSA